jgi:hypothetical protein
MESWEDLSEMVDGNARSLVVAGNFYERQETPYRH